MPNAEDIRNAARERQRKWRSKHQSFTVSFTKSEAREIEAMAKKKGYSMCEYLKALAIADLNGLSYVRHQDDSLQRMILETRAIGVNINQVVRFVNTYRELRLQDFQALQRLLAELESKVTKYIERRPLITDQLDSYLNDNPTHVKSLIEWLSKYDN